MHLKRVDILMFWYKMLYFLKNILLLILEKRREEERYRNINDEQESLSGCLLHTSQWGWSLKPVPQLGIKL